MARSMHAAENDWAGKFGNAYQARNKADHKGRVALFREMLAWIRQERNVTIGGAPLRTVSALMIDRAIEFGAGRGHNLTALKTVAPAMVVDAVEINPDAVERLNLLKKRGRIANKVHHMSMLDYPVNPREPHDLAFTRGVLIHIPPELLPKAYDVLHGASKRWILIAEYFNPTPMQIPDYHGKIDRLWKRDFAGEMMARHPDLKLRSYGFAYHGDPVQPQDDLTWFLMEKVK